MRRSSLMRRGRLFEGRLRRHIMRIGIELDLLELGRLVAGQRIELADRFDLVAEQREAPGAVLEMRGEDLDRVAAHPEGAAHEIAVIALVMKGDEIGEKLALGDALAPLHREGHGRIGLDIADAVDAGHRGDDDDIVALEQRARRRMAHAVDLLVDRGFLLDIGVGARHIGFRLVVIVIGDEIFDRVVGEEAPELAIELGGKRLVGREHQGRALVSLRSPSPW